MDRLRELTVEELIDLTNILPERRLSGDVILFDQDLELSAYNHIFAQPCRLDAISVLICTEGSLRVKVNLKEYFITEGMIVVNLPQNIIQIDGFERFRAKGIIVSAPYIKSLSVGVDMLMPLYFYFQRHTTICLTVEEVAHLGRYGQLLGISTLSQSSTYKREIVGNLISLLCYTISDIIVNQGKGMEDAVTNKHALIYEQFMRLLIEHHLSERSLLFYAEKMGLSPKYFSKIIYDFSGRSAADWIDEYVILEAKALLRYSRMSIMQIAEHLNFTTQSFFGRYFKHQTGVSPGEYRKKGL